MPLKVVSKIKKKLYGILVLTQDVSRVPKLAPSAYKTNRLSSQLLKTQSTSGLGMTVVGTH